jgi:hypothetical protein
MALLSCHWSVPGRKTDTKDCQWIAELLQQGVLRSSFVPPTPIRHLRDLTRLRTSLAYSRDASNIGHEIKFSCLAGDL